MIPGDGVAQSFAERLQLAGTQIRWSAASEIDELQLAAGDAGPVLEQRDFAVEGLDIVLHHVGVLLRVDAEIAELAALAAERNVQIHPQRNRAVGLAIEGGMDLRRELRPPLGERGVVGNEVAADFRLRINGHGIQRTARVVGWLPGLGFGKRITTMMRGVSNPCEPLAKTRRHDAEAPFVRTSTRSDSSDLCAGGGCPLSRPEKERVFTAVGPHDGYHHRRAVIDGASRSLRCFARWSLHALPWQRLSSGP
jgi:hypothetical protein